MESAHMRTPEVRGTYIHTYGRLEKILGQLKDNRPGYIFVEKKLLGQWPQAYAQYFPGIILVLRYINEHYSPQEEGMYLVAMHRK